MQNNMKMDGEVASFVREFERMCEKLLGRS